MFLLTLFASGGGLAFASGAPSGLVLELWDDEAGDWVSPPPGAPIISMSRIRTYRATVPSGAATMDEAKAMLPGLVWELSRPAGMQDPVLWPRQHLGGPLSEWTTFNSEEPMFELSATAVVEGAGGGFSFQMSFTNDYFKVSNNPRSPSSYQVVPGASVIRESGNFLLDYIGEYDLKCLDGGGTALGQAKVRYNAYDSFRTMEEIEWELYEAAAYVSRNYRGGGMYAEVGSLGKNTDGGDIPYIIITDSKDSLAKYLAVKAEAEANPARMLEKLNSGDPQVLADYKAPIYLNNVHPNEFMAIDCSVDFMWEIVKSHENGGIIEYDLIESYTEAGEARLAKEMDDNKTVLSGVIYDDPVNRTGLWTDMLGYLMGTTDGEDNYDVEDDSRYGYVSNNIENFESYYNIGKVELNVPELLKEVIFIIVPTENPVGRTNLAQGNRNGYNLNRDHLFQTQSETIAATQMISKWNPIMFFEFHGYHIENHIEPCTPPHEPNFEYDLFAKYGFLAGEAFGNAMVSNNDMFQSYKLCLRDHLKFDPSKPEGKQQYWGEVWDDTSTNYTPQYAMLHGSIGFTIEKAEGNDDGVKALVYGILGGSKYTMDNRADLIKNQVEFFKRGVENIDEAAVRPFYVDYYDNLGAEADLFRPKYAENNNFFPEYYVIPVDSGVQKNINDAHLMQQFLIRNGIKVDRLTADTELKDASGNDISVKAGSFVVNMRQAKRNVANAVFYNNLLIDTDWPTLYSEPVTAFGHLRGFDYHVVTKEGAFDGVLEPVVAPVAAAPAFSGAAGASVIIRNSSLAAVNAVNALLYSGKAVGFITEGPDKGHFVVSHSDYLSLGGRFAVTADGVSEVPPARAIGAPKLFIPGRSYARMQSLPVRGEYGLVGYMDFGNSEYGWDMFAYVEQMGFSVITDPDKVGEADVVVGTSAFSSTSGNNFDTILGGYQQVLDAIKAGKPYIATGAPLGMLKTHLLPEIETDVLRVESARGYDALFRVEYSGGSLITANREYYGNDLMYGFGGANLTAIPEGANVLITGLDEDPLMGFFPRARLELFIGSVQAFEYIQDGLDITVFANSITRKTHQQADYLFAANAIYSKMLGGAYTGTEAGKTVSAPKSTNTLMLNGEAREFPAVLINDYNWLRLRDVAMLLDGSAKQFSTSYSEATGTVTLTYGAPYAPVGDEFADILSEYNIAMESPQTLLFSNGAEGAEAAVIDSSAYLINDYNYFRLRDLAALLDFAVGYDEATGVITLDLEQSYVE